MKDCDQIISLRNNIDDLWKDCKFDMSLKSNINSRLDYCTDTVKMIKDRAYK